jgi:hypothetical protein
MLSWIAMSQPIDPHLDASATGTIFQCIDPVSIDLGHLHTHAHSVSHRIRLSIALESHINLDAEQNETTGDTRPAATSNRAFLRVPSRPWRPLQ